MSDQRVAGPLFPLRNLLRTLIRTAPVRDLSWQRDTGPDGTLRCVAGPDPTRPAAPSDAPAPDPSAAPGGSGPPRVAALLAAVVLTGLAAGAGGIALTLLLHLVEHAAFGTPHDPSRLTLAQAGADRASPLRRVLALTLAGVVTGTAWAVLRRATRLVSVSAAVAGPPHRLPFWATTLDAVVQVVAVGAGASLGREGAPRQVGAAAAAAFARWLRAAAPDRATLVAVGAGAGLAAVYDVPLAGAVFAVEVVLPTRDVRRVLVALGASGTAAAVTATVLGSGPVYAVAPRGVSGRVVLAGLVLGPVAGLVAAGFSRLAAAARRSPARGWHTIPAVTLTFAALGLVAWPLPEVLGNGQGLAQLSFATAAGPGAGALVALVVLKPLATAACLRSGAVGGLLTPSLSTGAALGALAAAIPGLAADRPALALVGAAAVLSATQRAPLTGIVLVLELTGAGLGPRRPGAAGGRRCVAGRPGAAGPGAGRRDRPAGDPLGPEAPRRTPGRVGAPAPAAEPAAGALRNLRRPAPAGVGRPAPPARAGHWVGERPHPVPGRACPGPGR